MHDTKLTKPFYALASLSVALSTLACDVTLEDSELATRSASQLSEVYTRPTVDVPIDVQLKSGEVMSFAGRYFFIVTDGAVVQPASSTTVVKAVRRGDVVGIKQSGVVRRFIAIGIDADGGIVSLNQQGFHGNVQGFIDDLPGEWGPDPGGVLDCINQATEEGQECVASGGDTACCMAYQGLALLMCGVDIWGHDIADDQGQVWANLCEGGGGLDPEDPETECEEDTTYVNDAPIDVNGQDCFFTGWVYSTVDAETGDCVTVCDLDAGSVACPEVDDGDVGEALEIQPL